MIKYPFQEKLLECPACKFNDDFSNFPTFNISVNKIDGGYGSLQTNFVFRVCPECGNIFTVKDLV